MAVTKLALQPSPSPDGGMDCSSIEHGRIVVPIDRDIGVKPVDDGLALHQPSTAHHLQPAIPFILQVWVLLEHKPLLIPRYNLVHKAFRLMKRPVTESNPACFVCWSQGDDFSWLEWIPAQFLPNNSPGCGNRDVEGGGHGGEGDSLLIHSV